MMSETKHTPSPWEATENGEIWHRHPAGDRKLCAFRGHTTLDDDLVAGRDCRNAKYAARCVNAHDDLLEACKQLEGSLIPYRKEDCSPARTYLCSRAAVEGIRTAIDKADTP